MARTLMKNDTASTSLNKGVSGEISALSHWAKASPEGAPVDVSDAFCMGRNLAYFRGPAYTPRGHFRPVKRAFPAPYPWTPPDPLDMLFSGNFGGLPA